MPVILFTAVRLMSRSTGTLGSWWASLILVPTMKSILSRSRKCFTSKSAGPFPNLSFFVSQKEFYKLLLLCVLRINHLDLWYYFFVVPSEHKCNTLVVHYDPAMPIHPRLTVVPSILSRFCTQASMVAPVVMTSSTKSTYLFANSSGLCTSNTLDTFSQRS
jgi:hypothetical protein